MSLSGLLVFAAALAVAAGSPDRASRPWSPVVGRGLRDVLPFLFAMWVGEVLWITAAVAGLSALARTFATLFIVIKFVGVAYLLILAWTMWFAPVETSGGRFPAARQPWRMFAAGLSVTLGNPKIMIFYAALLPTLIDLGRIGLAGWAELCITAVCVLALVDGGWALAAARASTLLRSRRAMRIANRTGASMMAGAAVAIATR